MKMELFLDQTLYFEKWKQETGLSFTLLITFGGREQCLNGVRLIVFIENDVKITNF